MTRFREKANVSDSLYLYQIIDEVYQCKQMFFTVYCKSVIPFFLEVLKNYLLDLVFDFNLWIEIKVLIDRSLPKNCY